MLRLNHCISQNLTMHQLQSWYSDTDRLMISGALIGHYIGISECQYDTNIDLLYTNSVLTSGLYKLFYTEIIMPNLQETISIKHNVPILLV